MYPAFVAVTPAPEGMDLLKFFLHSGPMAKIVLGLLTLMSLASWAIMLNKYLHFRKADAQSR
ncbi:MAG: flagellar motor protein MotA, partial [Acidobacteria bacterium]|nr:flagellar motor protein MotA [Acidobacteriota bacterium]